MILLSPPREEIAWLTYVQMLSHLETRNVDSIYDMGDGNWKSVTLKILWSQGKKLVDHCTDGKLKGPMSLKAYKQNNNKMQWKEGYYLSMDRITDFLEY